MQNHTTDATREALLRDVSKLKKDAAQVAQDVKEHAAARVDETRQRVVDTVESARAQLTENPFMLLGAGFALGLLCGLRLRR